MRLSDCTHLCLAFVGALCLPLAACRQPRLPGADGMAVKQMNADDRGSVVSTGIESQDMVFISDQVSRKLMACPALMNAPFKPRIALDPVKNLTRFPVDKDIFLDEMQTNLTQNSGGKFIFLARDRMVTLENERNLAKSGAVQAAGDPHQVQFKGADYFLTGKLRGESHGDATGAVSDAVFFYFQLIDAKTSEVVFADKAHIKKQGRLDPAYR